MARRPKSMSLISTRISSWSLSSILGMLLLIGNMSFGFAQDLAYVDLQRAVAEVDEGKAALNQLKGMMENRQKAFEKKKKEVEKLQENFQKQAQFMTDEVKQKKGQEFQTKMAELQQTYATMNRELNEAQMKVQQKILGQMSQVLSEIGKERDFKMIVNKEALLWAVPHLDITNEVIRRYNAQNSKGKKSKKKSKKSKKRKK